MHNDWPKSRVFINSIKTSPHLRHHYAITYVTKSSEGNLCCGTITKETIFPRFPYFPWVILIKETKNISFVLPFSPCYRNTCGSLGEFEIAMDSLFEVPNSNSSFSQTSTHVSIDLFINGDFCMQTRLVCFLVSQCLFPTTKLT